MNLAELSKILKRPLASELVLGRTPRPCERCKAPTVWAKPRQTVNGYCMDHALAGPVAVRDMIKSILAAFPNTAITTVEPEVFEPGEYAKAETRILVRGRWAKSGAPYWWGAITTPLDAGPCLGCRRTVRAYGRDAHPYCKECERRRRV